MIAWIPFEDSRNFLRGKAVFDLFGTDAGCLQNGIGCFSFCVA